MPIYRHNACLLAFVQSICETYGQIQQVGTIEIIWSFGETVGIPEGNAPNILDKDYTITAEITVPEGGAEGMIATFGGRFGGYALFLQKGKPVFVYNLLDLERFRWEGGIGSIVGEDIFGRALKPGKHTLVFDFKYDGPGPGKGGTGVDDSYEPPFKFTGAINKVSYKLGPSQMMPAEQKEGAEAVRKATD